MRKFILGLLPMFLIRITLGFAGETKYPVSAIPEELKEKVNVVIREDHVKFTILSMNSTRHYLRYVVTILNEKGNEYAKHQIGYDKLTKVLDISGTVYDANGKQIKKLKNKDISDRASFDGMTLFSDFRIKSLDLSQAIYPYTVELEYELESDFLYSIPTSYWGSSEASTENASYQLVYPTNHEPRYQLLNIQSEARKEKLEGNFESITWVFRNLKPLSFESFGPMHEELIPQLIAAPSAFEYEGFVGNMKSWQEYGKWQLLLNKGRDELPQPVKQKVEELINGKSTIEEKTKALYEYLQNKTRYVNITEGIGGLQPFPALVVNKNGYGDCKALSNYMIALLKEAGIKGFYTKIRAGERERQIKLDFPSHQTNHIVVSVPNGKDTLWLECTSQTNPFGYQGTFTEDRWALMVTEEGGKLVRTINYTPEQNIQSRGGEVSLDANGNASAKIKTRYHGIQYENNDLNWSLSSADKQKKWIEENTQIPNFSINSFSMAEKKDKIPSATINLDLTLSRYASVSGKRFFVSPNLMNKVSYVPPKMVERKTDVVLRKNYLDLDTIKFSLPENLYPEFLPEPVKINSKFGEYEASFQFDAGKVTYIRRMKMWKGRFPKETYNELVDFYKNVSKADNIKLVFLNKT